MKTHQNSDLIDQHTSDDVRRTAFTWAALVSLLAIWAFVGWVLFLAVSAWHAPMVAAR